MITAIYPGSFDPVTNGHIDIINRASRLFERLVIGVYDRPIKNLLFDTDERLKLVKQSITGLPNVDARIFSGMTVSFAREMNAQTIVRGLRMSADFEREFDLAMMQKTLSPEIEIVCLMSELKYQFLSSSLLKEAAQLGGDVSELVPRHVALALKDKFGRL